MLKINFNPFPDLSTDRLILKQTTEPDFEDFFKLRSNKNIMNYIARPLAKNMDDVKLLIEKADEGLKKNERINWGIYLKANGKLIGTIGYVNVYPENHRAEIGYLLDTTHHLKGIMHEAMQPVLDYGFKNLKLHSIEAVVNARNFSSSKLLEKNKFVKEAYFKDYFFHEEKFFDVSIYSLITPEAGKR